MVTILIAIATFFFMMVFHELGHIIIAKCYHLRIHRVGIAIRPIPHPFVEVSQINQKYIRNVFLFGGILMSVLIITTAWLTGIISQEGIYYGMAFHFIFEINPFYSDLTQSFKMIDEEAFNHAKQKHIEKGKRSRTGTTGKPMNMQYIRDQYFDRYRFSLPWYIHFSMWTIIIIYLVAPFGLRMAVLET